MKLSAVVISRNDNYGGNLTERSKYCLNSLVQAFDEVWYIDWNSPTHSLLYDIYDDIEKTGRLNHIIINSSVAQEMSLYDPETQKCCEVLARNLGICRATGDVIVSTNIDVISPTKKQLINFFNNSYNENTFYTISRRALLLQDILNFKFNDIEKLHNELDDKYPERHLYEKVVENDDYSLINCCGDFQVANRKIWHEIRGFEEAMRYCLYTDTNVQKKSLMHGFNLKAVFQPAVFHITHEGGCGCGGDGLVVVCGCGGDDGVYGGVCRW